MSNKKAQSLARVVKAAAGMFSQRPFEAVSIAEIADAAHCSTATIYDAFGSKKGLFREIQRHTGMAAEWPRAPDRAGLVSLLDYFSDRLAALSSNGTQNLLLSVGAAPDVVRDGVAGKIVSNADLRAILDSIEVCMRDGLLREGDVQSFAYVLLAGCGYEPIMYSLLFGDDTVIDAPAILAAIFGPLVTVAGKVQLDAYCGSMVRPAALDHRPNLIEYLRNARVEDVDPAPVVSSPAEGKGETVFTRRIALLAGAAGGVSALTTRRARAAAPVDSSSALADIPAMLQRYIDDGAAAGIVALVYRSGEIAQFSAVGMQDREANIAMQRGSIFRIASMTKPIVTAAAMTLVDRGKLALSDPIDRWLPELADRKVLNSPSSALDETHPAERPITVFDLLTHRSGLAFDFTTRGPISAAYMREIPDGILQRQPELTADDWLKRVSRLPLVHEPGSAWLYGVSADALAALVARVSGMALAEYLKEAILDPLGMADTGFWVPATKHSRVAALYAPAAEAGGLPSPVIGPLPDRPPAFGGGGSGLFSTADDYLRFARMLLDGGRGAKRHILSRRSIALMTTDWLTPEQKLQMPPPFRGDCFAGRGFGLNLAVIGDPSGLSHTIPYGSPGAFSFLGGYGTWWQVDPAKDLILVFMVQNAPGIGPRRSSPAVPPVIAFARQVYGAIT